MAHALYTIGAEPGHADELRAEVESAFAEHGHTRQAMADLVKMDSFLREVIRFNSGGRASSPPPLPILLLTGTTVTLVRIAQTDYTLADGTRIPKGALLSAAQAPTHHDEANYDGAGEFRPWRFVGLAGKEGRGGKGGVGMTGVDYRVFFLLVGVRGLTVTAPGSAVRAWTLRCVGRAHACSARGGV